MKILGKTATIRYIMIMFFMGFAFVSVPAPSWAQQTKENDITTLSGYKSYSVLSAFSEIIQKEPSLYILLQQNPEFSKKILNSATLQRQILQDIRKEGKVEQVVSGYLANINNENKQKKRPVASTYAPARPQQQSSAAQSHGKSASQATTLQKAQGAINQALSGSTNTLKQENAQYQLDKVASLSRLLEGQPEILEAILQNQETLKRVLEDGLTLEQILAEFGVKPEIPTRPVDPITPVSGVIDVNDAPSKAALALDANGWPAYLNVPPECAPRDENFAYRLEHSGGNAPWQVPDVSRRGPDRGDSMFSNHNVVRSHFNRGGNWWVVNLTAKEVQAAPFYTDNKQLAGRLKASYEFAHAAGVQVSISYCPGDFRKQYTPPNKPTLSKHCASLDKPYIQLSYEVRHKDRATSAPEATCILTPNTQYFLNYRLFDADPEMADSGILCAHTSTLGSVAFPQRVVKGETLPICGLQFTNQGAMHSAVAYPPYTGPCIAEGPFPMNYNAFTCGRVQTMGRSGDFPEGCNSTAAYKGMNKTCYDPENNLPPQRYVQSCSPDGRNLTWLEGYDAPAYSNYVCEDLNQHGLATGDESYPSYTNVVCAAHRDGEVRTMTCPQSAGPVRPHREVQQCQFDETRGRYDWAVIDRRHGTRGAHCQFSAHTTTAYKNTCLYEGKTYSLGTKINVTCTPPPYMRAQTYREELVCEQRAKEPARPHFASKSGHISPHISTHVCQVTSQR